MSMKRAWEFISRLGKERAVEVFLAGFIIGALFATCLIVKKSRETGRISDQETAIARALVEDNLRMGQEIEHLKAGHESYPDGTGYFDFTRAQYMRMIESEAALATLDKAENIEELRSRNTYRYEHNILTGSPQDGLLLRGQLTKE